MRYRTVISDSARWEGFTFRARRHRHLDARQMRHDLDADDLRAARLPDARLPGAARPISPWLEMLTRDPVDVLAALEAQPTAGSSSRTRRWTGCRTTTASRTSASAATRATSRCRGTTTWPTWTSCACSRPEPRQSASTTSPSCSPKARRYGPNRKPSASGCGSTTTAPTRSAPRPRRPPAPPADVLGGARPSNIVLLHYDDLKADSTARCANVSSRLGIPVDEARWPALVDAATFDQMRANADRVAPDTSNADLAGQPAVLSPGHESGPVAHAARRPRRRALLRTGRAIYRTDDLRGGCTTTSRPPGRRAA